MTEPESSSRWHHWVPRAYLRRWSLDGNRVCKYETLVPHTNYPVWAMRSIRSVASAEHLYTTQATGDPLDAFEIYRKNEVEDPALEALARAESGKALSPRDHHRITRLAIALDQRTPTSFAEHAVRWSEQIPQMLNNVLREARGKIVRAGKQERRLEQSAVASPAVPAMVKVEYSKNSSDAALRAEIRIGRELWLWSIRHALEISAPKIIAAGGLTWSVVEAPAQTEWFTSDHPLVRMNYNSTDDYDFGGGWGFKGSEVLLPLSPRALLYSKVAYAFPPRLSTDRGRCLTLQNIIARRAHRAIFASAPMTRVESMRRRVIDLAIYREQERQLEEWHSSNMHDRSADGDTS
jgi:hypothetical protein